MIDSTKGIERLLRIVTIFKDNFTLRATLYLDRQRYAFVATADVPLTVHSIQFGAINNLRRTQLIISSSMFLVGPLSAIPSCHEFTRLG